MEAQLNVKTGYKRRKRIETFLYHVICILFAVTAMYPILWMISSSLKESSSVFINASSLIPKGWHFENYVNGWQGFGGISFATFFTNTIIITLSCVLGTIISNPLIAYGFSRLNFKGKNFWFATIMIALMLPGQIVIIPQYIMFNSIGWVNTFLPLIVPAFFGNAFFIFQHMQFIRSIPRSLDEAATIDGCSKFRIYTNIIFPLIKPSVITSVIFQFYWTWDDFFTPLIYLTSPEKYTVSVALKLFSDPHGMTDWGAMFAMGILAIIPPILVFFIFQRYIVEGVSTQGLKG
ncbi:MAG: carbohydrate ABC transporter permease [Sporolactobacillus sp.]|jgi:multiple sugar transport system permease protein|nr:carbohydrate ABC transporter permease [Sporolactobacillus sp.]